MFFTSFSFAVFFVITATIYFLVNTPPLARFFPAQNNYAGQAVIVCASLVFYAFNGLYVVPLILGIVALAYCGGRCCYHNKKAFVFFLFIIFTVLPLLFFKYASWFSAKYTEHPLTIVLPLGISFYTFQAISYLADVYTGKTEAEKNPLTLAAFIMFFPTVSSGPIQRAGNLIPQLKTVHHFDYDHATDGMKLFAWGLFKKIVIADHIAEYVNNMYAVPENTYGCALTVAALFYTFQIYCDFSGYSDMAIGTAKFLGFDIGKNFDHPYLSQSVGEFWRRWHISLGSWLRDYIYIPLGGSRVAVPRIYANLLITFLVSGIWHGSSTHFVVWGLLLGVFLCIERLTKSVRQKCTGTGWKIFFILFTFVLITLSWVVFRAENMEQALLILKKIAGAPQEILHIGAIKAELGLNTKRTIKTLFGLYLYDSGGIKTMCFYLFLICTFSTISIHTRNTDGLTLIKKWHPIMRWCAYLLVCFWIIFSLNIGSSEFIYNQF